MIRILQGDCRAVLPTLADGAVQCCVTSPPYFGLRDYGVDGQIGLEASPDAFIAEMAAVFREVRRVLRDDGCLWLNLGDSYASQTKGSGGKTAKQATNTGAFFQPRKFAHDVKDKDLLMIPARVAIALQADGWWLRSDCIWHKPSPMPESVTDRPTSAHEHVFLLTKSAKYFYDADAVAEHAAETSGWAKQRAKGVDTWQYNNNPERIAATGQDIKGSTFGKAGYRNLRNVWTIASQPFSGSHFATMPPELAERCIKAGSKPGDTVLDPFSGAGTTSMVADRLQRNAIGIELNPAYAAMSTDRLTQDAGMFAELSV